jgi:hypothetical protein
MKEICKRRERIEKKRGEGKKCKFAGTGLNNSMARSNEILGWEGVGNRQLLCFFKALINWSMLTANLKFRAKKIFFFFFLSNVLHQK